MPAIAAVIITSQNAALFLNGRFPVMALQAGWWRLDFDVSLKFGV